MWMDVAPCVFTYYKRIKKAKVHYYYINIMIIIPSRQKIWPWDYNYKHPFIVLEKSLNWAFATGLTHSNCLQSSVLLGHPHLRNVNLNVLTSRPKINLSKVMKL